LVEEVPMTASGDQLKRAMRAYSNRVATTFREIEARQIGRKQALERYNESKQLRDGVRLAVKEMVYERDTAAPR
jgi:hypothetical protein